MSYNYNWSSREMNIPLPIHLYTVFTLPFKYEQDNGDILLRIFTLSFVMILQIFSIKFQQPFDGDMNEHAIKEW